LGASLIGFSHRAAAERAIPPLSAPVIDEAGLLSAGEQSQISDKIRSYMPTVQEEVWIVPSLEGEAIEDLSIRAAETWKLGTKDKGNGLILLIALQEHRMRIEVGQGIEGEVPDVIAGRIINDVLKAAFRTQNYAEGIERATDLLYRQVAGEDLSQELPAHRAGEISISPAKMGAAFAAFFAFIFLMGLTAPLRRIPVLGKFVRALIFLPFLGFAWFLGIFSALGPGLTIVIVVFVLLILLAGNGRGGRGGGWGGGPFIGGGWGGGGFGGGFGGGGGGWSGGGGGFSGGGASGGW
jgi:uncharacterized protein